MMATKKRMAQMINSYNTTPQYIDSYTQEMQVRKSNARLDREFNSLMQSIAGGYDGGVPTHLQPATEKKVAGWLKKFEAPAWLRLHYEYTKAE